MSGDGVTPARPPNSEVYSHISTAEIVKLFDQGLSHRKIGKRLGMGPCSVGSRLRAEGKVRSRACVTAAQLKEARLDPAWEARSGIAHWIVPSDRVVCRECGELKSELNANSAHSHLRGHKMTAREYKSKYPSTRLTSFARSADQNSRQGGKKTVQDLMDEFAAMYLTPQGLKACRRDPEHEKKHGIKEFVACRLCGLKSRTDLWAHLQKRHDGCSFAGYHARFPKAPVIPLCRKAEKNEAQKLRGRELRQDATRGKQFAAGKFIPARPIEEITKARIMLAAHLQLEGLKPYAMTDSLYPPAADLPDKEKGDDKIRRFGYTKKFLKRHRAGIEIEKRRLASLSKAQRDAIRSQAADFIHKNTQASLGVRPSDPQQIP
jgi:hypothetical protein